MGKVYLVGAGPGDPDLLTIKAKNLLELADVVIYDALVSEPILAMINPQAETINAGKRRGNHSLIQSDTTNLLIAKARESSIVVRLKGGDPFVFGRGGEEMFDLVQKGIEVEVGKYDKPVFLKRGMSMTIKELLMSAEYIIAQGNPNVVLVERGIRTFETATRNTLDIAAVPVLHEKTHLPVFVDPSHAAGDWRYVAELACAAVACGADGLMIEVHPNPERAYSDGAQSLKFSKFEQLMEAIRPIAKAIGRWVAEGVAN